MSVEWIYKLTVTGNKESLDLVESIFKSENALDFVFPDAEKVNALIERKEGQVRIADSSCGEDSDTQLRAWLRRASEKWGIEDYERWRKMKSETCWRPLGEMNARRIGQEVLELVYETRHLHEDDLIYVISEVITDCLFDLSYSSSDDREFGRLAIKKGLQLKRVHELWDMYSMLSDAEREVIRSMSFDSMLESNRYLAEALHYMYGLACEALKNKSGVDVRRFNNWFADAVAAGSLWNEGIFKLEKIGIEDKVLESSE